MYEQTSINFSYEALQPQLRVAEVIAQPLLKERLLLSVSGGLTSMIMMLYCKKYLADKYEMICVFANTGKEKEGTLKFVNDCAIRFKTPIIWVEAKHRDENGNPFSRKGWKVKHKVVNFESASRNGEPFEEMISVLGIPSTNAPFCSDQLKRKPIESYLKRIGWRNYYKAIGIRCDEIDRVNPHYLVKRIIYPFVSLWPKTKPEILEEGHDMGLVIDIHPDDGNCDRCWKKDMKSLCRSASREPKSFFWWKDMTTKYGYFNPRKIKLSPPFNFFRGNKSVDEIFELAQKSEKEIAEVASTERLDGCSESCEAF